MLEYELTHTHTHTHTLQSPRKKKSVRVDTYLSEVQGLIDDELKEELERFGKDCGPITDTTRAVYQRMLAKLMAERVTGKCEIINYTFEKACVTLGTDLWSVDCILVVSCLRLTMASMC